MNVQEAKDILVHAVAVAEAIDPALPLLTPIAGMTSPKFRAFLNRLLYQAYPYLEIGPYLGSTICAAMENNNGPFYVCDNFSEFNPSGENESIFWQNVDKVNPTRGGLTFFNQDCFSINLDSIKEKIGVYFYDGRHLESDQYNALKYFLPAMDDVFIYLVDDWLALPGLSDGVRKGTFNAIRDLKLTTHLHIALGSTKRDDMEEWGCGCGAFVLSKV